MAVGKLKIRLQVFFLLYSKLPTVKYAVFKGKFERNISEYNS